MTRTDYSWAIVQKENQQAHTHTQMEIRQMLTTHIIYTFIHDISVLVKMHHL